MPKTPSGENTRIAVDRLLAKVGQGRFLEQVYDAIEEMAREVQRTGNPGTVTAKFKLAGPKGAAAVQITTNLNRTMPTSAPEGATVFVDREIEGLHTGDPRQYEMEAVRLIESGEHVVDAGTGEIVKEA